MCKRKEGEWCGARIVCLASRKHRVSQKLLWYIPSLVLENWQIQLSAITDLLYFFEWLTRLSWLLIPRLEIHLTLLEVMQGRIIEVAEQEGGPFVLQVTHVLFVEQLKTMEEKVGSKALALYRDPVSMASPGHTSSTEWVLVTQGQMSALNLAQHYFKELSGWSASCKHMGSQPLARSSTPPYLHRCTYLLDLAISNPSSCAICQ